MTAACSRDRLASSHCSPSPSGRLTSSRTTEKLPDSSLGSTSRRQRTCWSSMSTTRRFFEDAAHERRVLIVVVDEEHGDLVSGSLPEGGGGQVLGKHLKNDSFIGNSVSIRYGVCARPDESAPVADRRLSLPFVTCRLSDAGGRRSDRRPRVAARKSLKSHDGAATPPGIALARRVRPVRMLEITRPSRKHRRPVPATENVSRHRRGTRTRLGRGGRRSPRSDDRFYCLARPAPWTEHSSADGVCDLARLFPGRTIALNVKELGYEDALLAYLDAQGVLDDVFLFDMELIEPTRRRNGTPPETPAPRCPPRGACQRSP